VFDFLMARPAHTASALAAGLAVALLAAPGAEARATAKKAAEPALAGKLKRQMRQAGRFSGAYVRNLDTGQRVFGYRPNTARILASNTKLFTTSAALVRYGADGTLQTQVLGDGTLDAAGIYHGNLYLRGGGDPTFGSSRFIKRNYGSGTSVEKLAKLVAATGIKRVTGRIYGDESRFDTRRGGPASGYRLSTDIGGPLSALDYNRGLASEGGFSFQTRPAAFAAARLDSALGRRKVSVKGAPRARKIPTGTVRIATVDSPPMAKLIRLTNKPSDNFFAEMLLKTLPLTTGHKGTTKAGAKLSAGFATRSGSRVRQADGSGLSRRDRATPYGVTRLLMSMRKLPEAGAFNSSLSIAGRDGTLARRMRGGPARRRCRGKTGTLNGVSALSGYCRARSGQTYAFSILMNGIGVGSAHRLQDNMAQAIAGVR
jgi:D-alanyl-D-alanine carboxypeptidase/D-alanyl-D-alanine-endopeptidase (penicillin-binding protein 4)